jgi:hypothetical protein
MPPDNDAVDILTISIATQEDGPELTALLEESYRLSPDFTVRDEGYFRDHFSKRSAVLIARAEGQLLGTMRANLISCTADLACEDEGLLTRNLVPAIYLSRAATVRSSRTRGVNSMLRMYCIEAALELNLASMVGFVYHNASRTRLMAELGYSFTPLKSPGNALRDYHAQCLFAKMDLKKSAELSLRILREQISQSRRQVTWQGRLIAEVLLDCADDGQLTPHDVIAGDR